MIITIDGPAGTGKSTAARGLAERLGLEFLDTGAMYRVVALLCLDRGIDPADEIAAARLAAGAAIEFNRGRTLAGGVDVTDRLRTPQVSQAASLVAQVPAVRDELVRQQRRLAAGLDIVCEGRDQGTVDPVERARRRQQELAETGRVVSLEDLLAEQAARDRRDESRAVAPLKPAPDAIRIDTTSLSLDAVLDLLERHVRRKR
jgi:cytidylate kinase